MKFENNFCNVSHHLAYLKANCYGWKRSVLGNMFYRLFKLWKIKTNSTILQHVAYLKTVCYGWKQFVVNMFTGYKVIIEGVNLEVNIGPWKLKTISTNLSYPVAPEKRLWLRKKVMVNMFVVIKVDIEGVNMEVSTSWNFKTISTIFPHLVAYLKT